MIRSIKEKDIETVMDIWLKSNIQAHNFITAKYWEDNYELVKEKYIPNSITYLYEEDNEVKGFISVLEGGFIGALFVKVGYQGRGIGKELIKYVKEKYNTLTLTVYNENFKAVEFYKREGFNILDEHIDENVNRLELTMKYEKHN